MKIRVALLFVLLFAAGATVGAGHLFAGVFALALGLTALGLGQPMNRLCLNTLTNLAPDIYGALDVVSRELVGIIPSIARDARVDRIAKGVTFRSPITPSNGTINTTTPVMAFPAEADQTIGQATLTMSNYQDCGFSWDGESEFYIETGPGFTSTLQDQFSQCFRTLVNNMESSIASSIALAASRAYGTAGTNPFPTGAAGANGDLSGIANVRRILDDNGAPGGQTPGMRSLAINTMAGANLRSMLQLTRANEAATDEVLRRGTLLNIHGIDIKETAGIQPIAAVGTAANATTNAAGYAVGATVITLAAVGTGTILAGDIITFARDTTDPTHKYVVAVGCAAVSGGVITLAAPGLKQAITAATAAITVLGQANLWTPNVLYTRNACLLATRLQKVPSQGDLAIDRMVVTDPISGISFEIAAYPGYRMITYKVLFAWGFSVIKPEHTALLLG